MNNVTACIKTIGRPACCQRLIDSIRQFYPDMPILVADDSEKPHQYRGITRYIFLPHDSGLSVGRNAMLHASETPFSLFCDDDFVFTERTRIEELRRLLGVAVADIACGDVNLAQNGYISTIHDFGNNVTVSPGCVKDCGEYKIVDLAANFLLAKTEALLAMGGWDAECKLGEHGLFFLRAKRAGLKTIYVPSVWANHIQDRTAGHERLRKRAKDFAIVGLKKHGILEWRGRDGRVTRA